MKKARCSSCRAPVQGSTSARILREAINHARETGHRSFSRVKGWGPCTLRPMGVPA